MKKYEGGYIGKYKIIFKEKIKKFDLKTVYFVPINKMATKSLIK